MFQFALSTCIRAGVKSFKVQTAAHSVEPQILIIITIFQNISSGLKASSACFQVQFDLKMSPLFLFIQRTPNTKHEELDHYHISTKAKAFIVRWKQRSLSLACGCLCAYSLMSFISYSRIYWLTKIIGPTVIWLISLFTCMCIVAGNNLIYR